MEASIYSDSGTTVIDFKWLCVSMSTEIVDIQSLELGEDGALIIQGKKHIHECNLFNDIPINLVLPEYLEEKRFLWFKPHKKVKSGWVRLKEEEKFAVTTSNWKIIGGPEEVTIV